MENDKASRLCGLCSVQFAAYTCPRCNVPYCSLVCYKGDAHGDCAEAFYRAEMETQLRTQTASGEQRRQMLDILQRVYTEHADEQGQDMAEEEAEEEDEQTAEGETEDGTDVLADRLAGVDLDDTAEVWRRMTAGERRQFERLVASGQAHDLLDAWQPWWLGSEVQLTPTLVHQSASQRPAVPANLPALPTLLGARQPAAELAFTLVDLLLSYVLVQRFFHGQPAAAAGTDVALSVSGTLGQGETHDAVATAVHRCMARSLASPLTEGMTRAEYLALLADVLALLLDQSHVTAALADLHSLLQAGQQSRGCSLERTMVKAAVRKAYFHLVWFGQCGSPELMNLLRVHVQMVVSEAYSHDEEGSPSTGLPSGRGAPKIQEIMPHAPVP